MFGVSANTLGIGIAIRLRDQFSAQAMSITNRFNQLHGSAQRVIGDNLRASRRVGIGMAAIGTVATKGMFNAINTAGEFQFVMKAIQGVTGKTSQELEGLSALALKLGTETIYTADEVAKAMEYMARSGFKLPDIEASIASVIALGAAAGGTSLGKGGMADYMTSILHQFNLAATSSGRVADVLAKAANISSSDVTDIAHGMSYAAGTSKILNVSLEETAAMFAVLSNAGLKGGIAGRSLNNMMIYLANAMGRFKTKKQMDAFQAIGLQISDVVTATGDLKPMTNILDAFSKKVKLMPKVDQVGALNALFNIRGQRAMIPLLEQALKIGFNFEDSLNEIMSNSSGYAKTISEVLMDSIKGDMMVLSDTWKTFKIEAGTALWAMFGPLVRFTTQILNNLIAFSKTPLGKPIILLVGALSLALTVGGALLVAFTTLKLMTLASTVSFANMGRTLTWAWTSSAAAALRYATVAKGAMLVNTPSGARWRNMATGRFVSNATMSAGGAAAGGAVASTSKLGIRALLSNLTNVSKIFGVIGNVMKGFMGGAMMIGTILVALIGFRNILKLVGYGLGSLVHAIMFIVDYIANLGEGPLDAWDIAKKQFKVRNEKLQDLMGIKKLDPALGNRQPGQGKGIGIIGRTFDPNKPLNKTEAQVAEQDAYFKKQALQKKEAQEKETQKLWELLKTPEKPTVPKKKAQTVSLHMSGQTVGSIILREQEEQGRQRLNQMVS
jgi:TP901 family phage tail tape measure protein